MTGVASPWREEGTVTLGAGDGRPPLCSAEAVGFGAHPAPGMSFLSTRYVPDPTLKHSGHRAEDVASVLEGLGDEREAGPDRGARVTAVGPRLRPEGPRRSGQAHAATAAGPEACQALVPVLFSFPPSAFSAAHKGGAVLSRPRR